ncbi:putative monooxygenase (luciferase-like) [Actinoplanes lobatus]|uniref:F420-dependent oxidoreductase-like protein n=1 Tax=Actinoplanes lobatus TaxID=113568 RepID=A0A7W7MI45_9ACTN|nr:TIGR03564 family F420-dependent LLM class oxidoreductase [Actinoplanes lobatus]MBB4751142.1 F420-dependent oxidoreductase-like protein [Actinoplanes lobatus]GGN94559.1 putative monooxygenase (luciferase-like) [Actinoplanes lobatus]GIE44638.1 putative monooxygenase (luciferase-like) [Actinoplanes lobatus]
MSLGVAIGPADAVNYVDETIELTREAAEAGLTSAWFGQRFEYDAAGLAAVVGRAVPGIRVGTSAIPVFGRHPILVAAQARTAQAATHGRFQLGLALGAPAFVEPALGTPFERPIARLREFLTALRTVLETGHVDHHGELITAVTPLPSALPGAEHPIPLLVAAMGPQALRVTGELADGTLPNLAGPRTLAEHIVPAITRAAAEAGRPRPRIIALAPAVVTADVDRARETAAKQLAIYDSIPSYHRVIQLEGADSAADLAVIGSEEEVAAAVQRYYDAGADEVVLTQTGLDGTENRRRTWKLLGALNQQRSSS